MPPITMLIRLHYTHSLICFARLISLICFAALICFAPRPQGRPIACFHISFANAPRPTIENHYRMCSRTSAATATSSSALVCTANFAYTLLKCDRTVLHSTHSTPAASRAARPLHTSSATRASDGVSPAPIRTSITASELVELNAVRLCSVRPVSTRPTNPIAPPATMHTVDISCDAKAFAASATTIPPHHIASPTRSTTG